MWRASCSNTPTHFNNITRLIRTLSVVSSEKKINAVWPYFLSFHNSPSIKYCLKCVLTDASVENSGDVEGFLMKQEIMTELRKSTWLSAWNLAFSAFFSPQSCMLCVKIFNMNRYISKSYTKTKAAIDRQHTERGQMKCQLLLVKGVHSVRRTALSEALKKLYWVRVYALFINKRF